jgi:hypothetical protein
MRWQIDYGDRPWHHWFAWYPVTLNGTSTTVWLEQVERSIENVMGYRIHSYREVEE